MKKIFIMSMFILITPLSMAKPAQPVSNAEHESNCRSMLELAYAIMQHKQEGMSLKEMLDRNDEAYKAQPNKFLYETSKGIARDAFSQPETLDAKKQLNDFSAKYYLACMEMYE